MTPAIEIVSLELTNACSKACAFCYNRSNPNGATQWSADEVVGFVTDCAAHGTKAVSFGGGEPLEYPALGEVLRALDGQVFRSITTNGLKLDDDGVLAQLVAMRPDKIHVSIHFPERSAEVERVARQVNMLNARGVRSGVNLVVGKSKLEAAREAVSKLKAEGLGLDRLILLPMRGADTPTPEEMARVADSAKFQSMSCLLACGRSERFCSVRWDKTVAFCSYTTSRRALPELTFVGLTSALTNLDLVHC